MAYLGIIEPWWPDTEEDPQKDALEDTKEVKQSNYDYKDRE